MSARVLADLTADGASLPVDEHGRYRVISQPRRWAWLLAGAVAPVLFVAYLRQARTVLLNSDGASNALQAWDMLHGNVLLHGWTMSDVSFWTTELPLYMLIESGHGLNGDVIHIATAMTYTLLVIGAGLVAKGDTSGREGLIRALVAGGIMLAPSLGQASQTFAVRP